MPKILFISYYFPPFSGVGAKRVAYWAEEISSLGYQPSVVTAIKQDHESNNVYHVPNTLGKRLFSSFIKDEGYSWEIDLIRFFQEHDPKQYDYILISGGPFMHMNVTKHLKRVAPNANLILDFRDPFSRNPRFNEGWLKCLVKGKFEKQFCQYADGIVTVNKYCAELIETSKTVKIIENGYDERAISVPNNKVVNDKFTIAHAGSLYEDRNPSNLLSVIASSFSNEIRFEQYGKESPFLTNHLDSNYCSYKGLLNYSDLCSALHNADACVLFTGGKAFESTTKIFDYIALGKNILIVTEADEQTGNLHEITKNYPNVIWSKNHPDHITRAIAELMTATPKPFDSTVFSRRQSLIHLVEFLKQLR